MEEFVDLTRLCLASCHQLPEKTKVSSKEFQSSLILPKGKKDTAGRPVSK